MYILPIMLLFTFGLALVKRVNLFDSFTDGIKDALKLILELIPFLAAIFISVELMRQAGITKYLNIVCEPVFVLLGIPKELCELLILRPLSGSGSLVFLKELYSTYGVDSYIARSASVIMAATDTVLYIAAVYFAQAKDKRSGPAIPIALFATFAGTVLACALCRIM